MPVVCDHLELSQVRELVSRIDAERGRLDILVNNIWGGDSRGPAGASGDVVRDLCGMWVLS